MHYLQSICATGLGLRRVTAILGCLALALSCTLFTGCKQSPTPNTTAETEDAKKAHQAKGKQNIKDVTDVANDG